MTITQERGGAIVETPQVAFTYQVAETPRDFDRRSISSNTLHWNNVQNYIGDLAILPYGAGNDLPQIIKDVVDNSSNVPGILKRKTDMLWGSGPKLFKEDLVDNVDVRTRVNEPTIQKWLDNIRHEDLLLKSCVDFQHIQGIFSRVELNKGSRVGSPFIHKLHHVQPDVARLARLRTATSPEPTHVVTSSWNFKHINAIAEAKEYHLFDYSKPEAYDNSILYSNMYTFCTDYYNVPDLYGSIEWIQRNTAVPLIFKALSKNSINIKYHIISPAAFWDRKRSALKTQKESLGEIYTEDDFKEYERSFLKQIGDVLTGDENAGKFLHTVSNVVVKGHDLISEGWEIKVIDQKVKDFVQSQILIADKSDKVIASSVGIHPVLANQADSGQANSGNTQIYALLNYLNTGVDIQEMIICKAINTAIKFNFKDSGVKIGFFQKTPEMQSQVAPEARSKPPLNP